MPPEYSIRRATSEEAEIIRSHRHSMFVDMGHTDIAILDGMSARFLPWVQKKMEAGEYLAWFAVAPDGSVAAGVGLWLMDWPPHMIPGTQRGNIVNVYTHQDHRRRGLARKLMNTVLEWCRQNSIRTVILHASSEGRALYESLGFRPTNEMRLVE